MDSWIFHQELMLNIKILKMLVCKFLKVVYIPVYNYNKRVTKTSLKVSKNSCPCTSTPETALIIARQHQKFNYYRTILP